MDFVVKCQQVKADIKSRRYISKIRYSRVEMGQITMDLVTGLPWAVNGFDSIWVILDRLIKTTHFLLVRMTYKASQNARLYLDRIVPMHRDAHF